MTRWEKIAVLIEVAGFFNWVRWLAACFALSFLFTLAIFWGFGEAYRFNASTEGDILFLWKGLAWSVVVILLCVIGEVFCAIRAHHISARPIKDSDYDVG